MAYGYVRMLAVNAGILLLCILHTHFAHASEGLHRAAEIALIQAFEKVPDDRSKDIFDSLTESQRAMWAYDSGMHVNETVDTLFANHLSLFVDVKLVGFHGDGNQQVRIPEADLQRYLHIIEQDLESVVLDTGTPLVFRPHIVFRVWNAGPQLVQNVESAILAPVKQAVGDGSPLRMVTIPHVQLNNAIRADYLQEHHGTYTIYLLNPRQAVAPYLYTYGSGACPGQLWVGDLPYVWVDLGAGPTRYGPGPGGQGLVLPHSIPRLTNYKKGALPHALLPDLAAFTMSISRHVIWPPMQHASPKRSHHIDVHLVYLHEDLVGGRSFFKTTDLQDKLQTLLGGVQTVAVAEHFVSFAQCEFCTAALSSAVKTRTRRARTQFVSMENQPYVDSKELHAWLTNYADFILSHAGVHETTDDGMPNTLPVFIFDLSTNNPLLLDGETMAIGVDNMAVAVVTRSPPTLSRMVCDSSPVMLDNEQASRAIMAAIMQSGWAVADPAQYWHPATGVASNYLLHVGNTPFGLLSHSEELPFVIGYSAKRNLLLAELNNSLTHATTILKGFERLAREHAGELDKMLTKLQLTHFRQRVNLLTVKAETALAGISRRDFAHAFLVAHSMRHDVDFLHRQARRVDKEHHLALVCPKHPLSWTIWLLPVGCVVGVALAVYVALSSQDTESDSRYRGL